MKSLMSTYNIVFEVFLTCLIFPSVLFIFLLCFCMISLTSSVPTNLSFCLLNYFFYLSFSSSYIYTYVYVYICMYIYLINFYYPTSLPSSQSPPHPAGLTQIAKGCKGKQSRIMCFQLLLLCSWSRV